MLSFYEISILLLAVSFSSFTYGAPIPPRSWLQTQQLVAFLPDSTFIQHKPYFDDIKIEHKIHHSDNKVDHHRYQPGNSLFLYDNDDNHDGDSIPETTRRLPETEARYWATVLFQLPEIYSSASPLLDEVRIKKEAYHQLIQPMACKLGIIMQNSNAAKNQSWRRWFYKGTNNKKGSMFMTGKCTSVTSLDSENGDNKTNNKGALYMMIPQSIISGHEKGGNYQDDGSNRLGMSSQKRSAKNDAVMQVITSDVMF